MEWLERLIKRIASIEPKCPYKRGTDIALAWQQGYLAATKDLKRVFDFLADEIDAEERDYNDTRGIFGSDEGD